MSLLDGYAFAPLGTINLPTSSTIFASSCNPVMDLVAVCSASITPRPSLGVDIKGKGKAKDNGKIALWRMSGNKVWEVDFNGIVLGTAWSPDGLHLSVLSVPTLSSFPEEIIIRHLSVHDGSIAHTASLEVNDLSLASWAQVSKGDRPWHLEWSDSNLAWPTPTKGSGRMIVDALPMVTPVEPPKPTNPHMLMLANAAAKRGAKGTVPHTKLANFPSLLPAYRQSTPHVLHLAPPHPKRHQTLLTGTFNLSAAPDESSLIVAEIAHRIYALTETVLKGVENAEHAQKEGAKQTMIWREELETCGEQQGMTVKEVHADLFKFMMTGRGGPGISEWLGNRLTGRVLTKWETTVDASFKDIHKVVVESVSPALERVLLLLDELERMPTSSKQSAILGDARDTVKGMIIVMERIRRLAKSQNHGALEWFRWLHYEIARTSTHDPSHDTLPNATHDLKQVWSFSKAGFFDPPMSLHLPGPIEPGHLLPEHYQRLSPPACDLKATLRDTSDRLAMRSAPRAQQGPMSSPTPQHADMSESSMEMSMMTDVTTAHASRASSPDDDLSSQGTVENKVSEPATPPRKVEAEATVWAHGVCDACQRLFQSLQQDTETRKISAEEKQRLHIANLDPGGETIFASRTVGDLVWVAYLDQHQADTVWLASVPVHTGDDEQVRLARYEIPGKALAFDFFDDEELALVVTGDNRQSYLVTVAYTQLVDQLSPPPLPSKNADLAQLSCSYRGGASQLPIARSRSLGVVKSGFLPTLALNGREGRRVACVSMGDGHEIHVFDMEDGGDGEVDELQGDASME